MLRRVATFLATALFTAAVVEATPNQATPVATSVEIRVTPGFDHVPLPIALPNLDLADATLTSDLPWTEPTLDVENGAVVLGLATSELNISRTAVVTVTTETQVVEIFVHAIVAPLNAYRLVEDPVRPYIYGIHYVRDQIGAIFRYDPYSSQPLESITVGETTTDLAIGTDGSELAAISSLSEEIHIIDLESFSVTEVISLPDFGGHSSNDGIEGDVAFGPGDVIYYIDGTWGPVLRAYDRSEGRVIQAVKFSGSESLTNTTGFQDIALNPEKTVMVAMPQYGWGAGAHSPTIASFDVADDGRVSRREELSGISNFNRDPFKAQVLMSADGAVSFLKDLSVDTMSLTNQQGRFSGTVWSVSGDGRLVATAAEIADSRTGMTVFNLPVSSEASAFTRDNYRFVYFDPSTRELVTVDLVKEVGPDLISGDLFPPEGAVVLAPEELRWTAVLGISQYDVYLGTNEAAVATATPESDLYLGRIANTQVALAESLPTNQDYFWRVDPINGNGPVMMPVRSFRVNPAVVSLREIEAQTVSVHQNWTTTFEISSTEAGQAFSVEASEPWITVSPRSGTLPVTVTVTLDATQAEAASNFGSIEIEAAGGTQLLPVLLEVEPFHPTKMVSDPDSSLVYIISENDDNYWTNDPGTRAYLLEVDTATETILQVVPAGDSVTDMVLHPQEDRVYVTNWRMGNLLAFDRDTLDLEHSFRFGAGSDYYNENDVYDIAAGFEGRLIVQEEDQWVDAQIFNTLDGKLISGARVHVREGGAVTDSTGRYYYHGENNSSGANLRKYDLLGDTFTPLGSSRPGEGNYYGSRTVVISEDDSRIFWAGTAFDRDLNIVWDLPSDVYSVSPTGRYAFGESTIYDINRRTEVLGMPLQTNVSAFNSETEKLITGDGKGLRFDLFRAPFALAPPVPISFSATASSVTVAWEDHSFELEFRLEYRRADEAEWTVVSESLPQNQTSYELRNLSPGSDYEIRLRAAANDLTSTWSETLRVTTTPVPPSRPNLVVSALSMTAITIGWTADLSLPIHFERREQDASAWEPLAVIPPEAAGTYVDRGLKPDTRYYYRARVEDRGIFSSYSWERSARTLVPQPPSFPQLRFAYPVAADTIELFWAIVPGASEIRVERRTDGGPWEPLAELPPEATRYLDAEVSSSSVLEYRVVAINEFGETPSSVLIASDLTAFQTLIDEETADGFDVDLWNPTAPSSTASFHQSYTFPEYTYSSSSGSSSFLETTDFNLDEFYGPLSSDEGFSFPPSFAILETFELPLSDDSILRLEFSEPITDASDYQIFVSEDGWNYTQVNGETVDSTTLLVELPAHGPTRLRLELGYQLLSHLQRVTVRSRGASEPIVPVPYVLTEPLNSTAVLVQWPMPEPSRWFLWANPFAAYRFRVERRGLQNDWQELDTILSSADPYFVDDTAPADSALQYRVVRVTPTGESAPSVPTFVRTMTQFSEWAQNNAPELLSGAPITDEHVLAFALGASPRVTRSADSSRLQMNVLARRHDLNPGVGYVLMGSHDLHHWEELAVEASAEAIDARWEEVSYNLPKEPIFVRLEVQVIE